MLNRTSALCLVGAIVLLMTGCTHTQLQRNTVNQASTLNDTYTQQVMDNLAMFVYDPGSMPQFAFPSQGTTAVNDSVTSQASLGWQRFGITSFLFGAAGWNANGGRQMNEAWTMQPVRDPHKLALMRCAYQHAVASCLGGQVISSAHILYDDNGIPQKDEKGKKKTYGCPDCEKILKRFHVHDDKSGGIGVKCIQNLSGCGWFGAGGKDDVPKDCGCMYVGRYCDQYVWVLPGQREKLTHLTLAVLDYAVNDPPAAATKTVRYNFDINGNPVSENCLRKAVGYVEMKAGKDDSVAEILEKARQRSQELELLKSQKREFMEKYGIDNTKYLKLKALIGVTGDIDQTRMTKANSLLPPNLAPKNFGKLVNELRQLELRGNTLDYLPRRSMGDEPGLRELEQRLQLLR